MEEFVFEAFEASPIAASVMASDGRLLCSYPGPIVAVSTEKVLHPDFLGSLTSFLESMTLFPVTQAVPIVKKAGSSVPEIRDTTDPMFIVGMLAGILRGIGRGIGITTPDDKGKSDHRIEKCIRDDVLWHKARGKALYP